jgi:methylenetetrahydrofolate reductase (NADPH)
MFFDNQKYFDYLKICDDTGITAPVIPGIKILTRKSHINNIPKNFFIDIPEELSSEIAEAKEEHVLEIGVNWAAKQVEELLNKNVPAVHFYIMQDSTPIKMLMKKLHY